MNPDLLQATRELSRKLPLPPIIKGTRSSLEFSKYLCPALIATLMEFFWERVDLPFGVTDEDCWNWTGTRDKDGYGLCKHLKFQLRAHRVSYLLHRGELDGALEVAHSCDNPRCVNPSHLSLQTRLENMQGCRDRGRYRVGLNHHMARLTELDVVEIRRLDHAGMKQRDIGIKFDITPGYVSDIVTRKSRRHVP